MAKAASTAGRPPNQIRIIGGDWRRTPLPVADVEGLRPTPDRVRETLFNWLGQRLDGMRCLDLFAGSGALGFEAASRGAARVLMIERNSRAIRQLRANQVKLAATAIEIVEADAMRLAPGLPPGSFDVIFLDPPFDAELLVPALQNVLPLAAADAAIYVEAPQPLDRFLDGAVLGDWQIVRQDRAGAVHYHLLRRENKE